MSQVKILQGAITAMRIQMDGPARLHFEGDDLILEGASGGEPVTLSFKRVHSDIMAAEYFDMLMEGRGPPGILASFMAKAV